MTSRIGFILGDTTKGVEQLIASGARPRVVKIHNNIGHAQQLHAHLGNDTLIIIRMIGPEVIVNRGKPAAQNAVEWCTAMEPAFQLAPWAFWEVGPPLQPADQWYADFCLAAMNWMRARGYLGVVITVGEGNPQVPSGGGDGWAVLWPVVQLAASYGFLLGTQAYWIDGNMSLDDDWHMFRIYRAFRDYPGKWPAGTRIVFTECGIDLRTNDAGWKTALGGDGARYRAGINALDDELARRACPPGVEITGFTLFALHENLWPDFNFWEIYPGLLDDIKAKAPIIEVPPTQPPENTSIKTVSVSSVYGCNHRAQPSSNSTQLGYITQGTRLIVEYPAINNYVRVLDKGYVYAPNLTIIGG